MGVYRCCLVTRNAFTVQELYNYTPASTSVHLGVSDMIGLLLYQECVQCSGKLSWIQCW